jgi:hypothetical protein
LPEFELIDEFAFVEFEPLKEFVFAGLFEDELELFDAAEFLLPALFGSIDEFVLVFDRLELAGEPAELSRVDEFRSPPLLRPAVFVFAPRVLPFDAEVRFAFGLTGRTLPVVSDHWKFPGRLEAPALPPPAAAITTSSRLPRCSTWAVAPGCRRKDSTVLLPLRWAVTSAKPRPRTASALGTSAAGTFT